MKNKYYEKIDYELLDKKVAYKGKRITVEELHYRNPRTNDIIYREHVLAGHAAIIIPETDDGKFIMIREPRTPVGIKVLAFPAGMIEKGETEEEGAVRELEEETGYRAKNITKLREVYPAISKLIKTQTHFDETEDIEVLELPIEEVKEMLDNGEIKTSSEAVGLLNYFMYEYKK